MDCGAPIAQKEYELVIMDAANIRSAYTRLKMFMNELNAQMHSTTSEAAPIAHSIAEAHFLDDMPNPFSGIVVWHSLIINEVGSTPARIDNLMEVYIKRLKQLFKQCECRRAVDVNGYITTINAKYLHLIKEKQAPGGKVQRDIQSVGVDPTGPAARLTKFPVGVSFAAIRTAATTISLKKP